MAPAVKAVRHQNAAIELRQSENDVAAVASCLVRVVHVVLQLDTGGMEKLLIEFARYADRSRFQLRFVSITSRGCVADELEALGWPVVALEEPGGLRPQLVVRLARLFREWKVDVAHFHNTKPLIYGAPAARLAGVRRTLYTRHGQRHRASRGQNILFRLGARFVDDVVCVSRDSAERSSREGIDLEKIRIVWNGINLSGLDCVGPKAAGPLVMVGRLSPEKDIETLLHAVAMAHSREPGVRLEIAGDGECRASLENTATKLGLRPDIVRFLGRVQDIPSLLGRASMFVLSSLTEGISLAILEAMACGLPVVATNVGGNPELVSDGCTGYLLPPRDPARLAQAILNLWRDPQRAGEMGSEGRRRVELHFDAGQMVAKYERLYCSAGEMAITGEVAPMGA